LIRDLAGGDDRRVEETGGVLRQRCIIRIYGTLADDPLGWLPPTQTKGIPGFQGKTPVAQMHFASELPLSQGNHSSTINDQRMIIQANPGLIREKWGKSKSVPSAWVRKIILGKRLKDA
jgi:hypothetical protein